MKGDRVRLKARAFTLLADEAVSWTLPYSGCSQIITEIIVCGFQEVFLIGETGFEPGTTQVTWWYMGMHRPVQFLQKLKRWLFIFEQIAKNTVSHIFLLSLLSGSSRQLTLFRLTTCMDILLIKKLFPGF
jgi:hypothetical protein